MALSSKSCFQHSPQGCQGPGWPQLPGAACGIITAHG